MQKMINTYLLPQLGALILEYQSWGQTGRGKLFVSPRFKLFLYLFLQVRVVSEITIQSHDSRLSYETNARDNLQPISEYETKD